MTTAITTKLYLAYGSNMNRAQMARRCPKAKALRAITVDDARLVFRGVADIEYCEGASVPVVLWEITAECERALDRFEGVAAGVYEKKTIPLDNGEQALTYVMRSNGVAPPSREYYERIKQGYADFGIDPEPLDVALKHSHVKTNHTPETRRRMARNMAAGAMQARRPMHVPLNKIEPRRDVREDRTECVGYEHFCECDRCMTMDLQRSQKTLPLQHKPVVRPVEGYNYSEAAKRGSRSKAGAPTGRKVVSNGRNFKEVETEATNTGKVRTNRGKRTNTVTRQDRPKNLSDWMKEKGYR